MLSHAPGYVPTGRSQIDLPASPNDGMGCPPSITGFCELIRLAEGADPGLLAARHGMGQWNERCICRCSRGLGFDGLVPAARSCIKWEGTAGLLR